MDALHNKHRSRMRNKYRESGLDAFADHEVLELLLFYAIPRVNVNGVAHELMRRFGTLDRVFEADASELCEVPGIGENTALLIGMIPDFARRYALAKNSGKLQMSDCEAVAQYLVNYYIGQTREKVNLLLFDNNGKLIETVTLHDGAATGSDVNVERIAEIVFSRKAASFILAHNHPGGAEPSRSDLALTRSVYRAFENFRVNFRDHIIVAGGKCRGILAQSLDPTDEIWEKSVDKDR